MEVLIEYNIWLACYSIAGGTVYFVVWSPQAEYHPADDAPKLVAAVVDVETTGTSPEYDKIIE